MEPNKIRQSVIDHARSDIVTVVSKYIQLQPKGTEFEALCPFHEERSPSFTVSPAKGMFYCFGCGTGGDAVDFVMKYTDVPFPKAVQQITSEVPDDFVPPVRKAAPVKVDEWVPIYPVPDYAPPPPDTFGRRRGEEFQKLPISMRWAYRDAQGQLLGYTCRFELPEGGKDVIPQTFCVNTNTGETRWNWLSFIKPRPIYGLDKLAQHPNAQVMVVEGEKSADFGQALFGNFGIGPDKVVTIAWPGGAKAIKFIDWTPLAGRSVGLWPDADIKNYPDNHRLAGQRIPFLMQPGTSAMLAIYDAIAESAKTVKFIIPPADVADGWDLADAGDDFDLLGHLRANSILAADVRDRFAEPDNEPDPEPTPPSDETPPWDSEDIPPAPEYEESEAPAPPAPASTLPAPSSSYDEDEFDEELVANGFFTILGYDGDDYYFFQHEKGQVLSRTSGQFSETGLTELAPTQWWEANFPGGNGKFNKMSAVNWIFRTANSKGIYDPTRVRGRGAWVDKGRVVFHHGSHLSVDGVYTGITDIKSAYVYPLGRSMPVPADPMTDEEGRRLVKVVSAVRWSMPASAALLAGFAMLAPICGALSWRPHIWILGAAGSGKSTVQSKFLGSLLRGIGVYAQGDSTEPGIRQNLRADALPVLVDELESNNEQDKKRTESIIGLVRKTSSESWAKTLKGTANGDAMSFQIRSMFCLASINANMPTKADIDRLTMLNIRSPDKKDPAASKAHWNRLEDALLKIEQDETISARLLARALTLMPVIRQNVEVFRKVCAVHFGTQREGDQFGTLLAGCWSMMHSEPARVQDAMSMLQHYDFHEHTEDNDQDEAVKALEAILSAKIRLGTRELSVFELIRETDMVLRTGAIDALEASAALVRHGIRVENETREVWFGVSVSTLAKLVEGKSFVTDLRGQLLRVKDARRVPPKKFNGVSSRCIAVPLDPILSESDDGDDDSPI